MSPASPRKWPRALAWGAVVLIGTFSLAVLAWSRGEQVSALWAVVAAVCVFAVSYRFHAIL
jgi:carbon starvation protein